MTSALTAAGGMFTLSWADQINVRAVRRQIDREVDDRKVAAYIARHGFKAT